MKKNTILTVLAFLSCFVAGYAQDIKDVLVKELTMEVRDGYLNVDMDLDLTDMSVKTTQVVVLTPCIVNGKDTLLLKSVAVYGRNRKVFYMRNDDIKPTGKEDDEFSPNEVRSGIIDYTTSVSFASCVAYKLIPRLISGTAVPLWFASLPTVAGM